LIESPLRRIIGGKSNGQYEKAGAAAEYRLRGIAKKAARYENPGFFDSSAKTHNNMLRYVKR
tara:strand:- start:2015 stop:2200 length:186 start_codon:yes stop_codon:yes gene_type:complete